MKKEKNVKGSQKRLDIPNRIPSVCIYLLAFAVPFTMMCIAFAASKVYPFGNRQILAIDSWNQYYPFLVEFRRKIRAGESLLYSWRLGMGTGYTAVIAYYLASPLNLLFVLFPESLLREAFALLTLIKIGIAGTACAFSLDRLHRINDYGTVIFSTFYALCSWTLGYYWNIMWLDAFALFPLVVLGMTVLVKEKNYKLYTISLAAAIVVQYYIGLLICIFTAVYFFSQCICNKNSLKELWNNLKNIILFSAISIMMSAVVTLPSLVALRNKAQEESIPSEWGVIRGWIETLANSLAYGTLTYKEGLPNIYCGVLCIVLSFAFYKLKKISLREKIVYFGLVIIFFLSVNINILDFAWHGFHVPNMIPHRYTFMFSFLLVMLAHKVYSELETLDLSGYQFVCIACTVYYLLIAVPQIVSVVFEIEDIVGFGDLLPYLIKNLLLIAVYLGVLFLFVKKKFPKNVLALLLAVIAGLELIPMTISSPETVTVTGRNNYPENNEEIQEILSNFKEREDTGDFYRTEFTKRFSRNPSVLYGYNGFDIFTSTVSRKMRDLYENLGLVADDNGLWYYYQNSTPVNNTFLNLKYLISRKGAIENPEYFAQIEKCGDVYAYENQAYLPIGFMVEDTMSDFQFGESTPFEKQNELVQSATGITEDVFETLDVAYVAHKNLNVIREDYGIYNYKPSDDADKSAEEKFEFYYQMPEDGSAYVYIDMDLHENKEASIGVNGRFRSYEIDKGNIFPVGTLKEGDVFSVRTSLDAGRSGNMKLYVGVLKQDVFDRAYDLLKDEVLNVSHYTSKGIKGAITAKQSGLMYTSIPYETGWNVYVDGKKAEITFIADALIGVRLSEGEHIVELKYVPLYVYFAVFISAVGIGLFVGICIWDKKKRLKL